MALSKSFIITFSQTGAVHTYLQKKRARFLQGFKHGCTNETQEPWFTTYYLYYYVNFLEGKKKLATLLLFKPSKVLAENYVSVGPISVLQMGSAMC